VAGITKDLSKSISVLQKLKSSMENEQKYWNNLVELSMTVSVPPRIKLDLLVPGRRFLQSGVFQQHIVTNGKLKPGNQMLVFLFNDLLLFTQNKLRESKRLSSGSKSPQLFRLPVSPRSSTKPKQKNKLMEFMPFDSITIVDKAFGSDLLIEFICPGKRIVAGLEDAKVKQEWLRNLRTEIATWKSKKGIVEKMDKPEKMDSRIERRKDSRHTDTEKKEKKVVGEGKDSRHGEPEKKRSLAESRERKEKNVT